MGGEPTFVSIDDYQGAEWNTAALGPMKRVRCRRADPPVARSLRAGRPAALRPGQMVSGRTAAALGLCALLAPRRRSDLARRKAHRARDAQRRCRRPRIRGISPKGLRHAWESSADYVQPAYEDPADRMIKQGLIPENVDTDDPKVDDPVERARILKLFDSHAGAAGRLCVAATALDCTGQARMAE